VDLNLRSKVLLGGIIELTLTIAIFAVVIVELFSISLNFYKELSLVIIKQKKIR
jgi:hypothetical protein